MPLRRRSPSLAWTYIVSSIVPEPLPVVPALAEPLVAILVTADPSSTNLAFMVFNSTSLMPFCFSALFSAIAVWTLALVLFQSGARTGHCIHLLFKGSPNAASVASLLALVS